MNNKIKILISVIIFVILITGSVFIYNNLSDKYRPDNRIDFRNGNKDSITITLSPWKNESSSPDRTDPSNDDNNYTIKYKAPDFTVFDAQGNPVKLSDFVGKPVVLNFWASWCPPCREEMPDFNEVYPGVKDDVHFMMVDLVDGRQETREKGQKFINDNGYVFPVYFDNNQDAAYTYWVSSIPATYFIDAEGYVVTGYRGAISKEILLESIELIKGDN